MSVTAIKVSRPTRPPSRSKAAVAAAALTSRDGDRSSLAATNASSSAIGPMGTTPASLLRSR
jgi:hypothetical protein